MKTIELKQLSRIGMNTVLIAKKDGTQIIGKITSHKNVSGDLNAITQISVMPEKGVPVPISIDEIESIEILEEGNYYLNLSEV